MYPIDERLVAQRIVLTAQRVATRTSLGPYTEESMQAQVHRDVERAGTAMRAELSAYVLTQRLHSGTIEVGIREQVPFETYATWWDAFKAEVIAPLRLYGWIARRWPPKTVVTTQEHRVRRDVEVSREAMFPYADMPYRDPSLGEPVLFETHRVVD